jgi:hypothetical protein
MTLQEALRQLIEAAKPFTSGDVVTETSGTIPLMEALERAIHEAEDSLNEEA